MSTPTWFTGAIAEPFDTDEVDAAGARISYRAWGKPGQPGVVLVHGGAAHAGWWDHIAPFLAADHRVMAIDLSGHGSSEHRESYSLSTWADEVMTVAARESDTPPVIIGHSMGGFVAFTAAVEHGPDVRGVAAIDSPVREMSPEARAWLQRNSTLPPQKVRPDRETIVTRFRTLPEDVAGLEYVRKHIAEQSVRKVDGGWTWSFDPSIFLSSQMEPEDLASAACEVALVRGERGMATTDITSSVAEIL
ncbi:alpha/beta fold hydrolase, partial [Aeromicrobium sp.]|uniref:alpha/beta fold hydrolase n=1 Tax=Aeromicrobium sp. TaxID=1871063 RepID=UPI003D6BAB11